MSYILAVIASRTLQGVAETKLAAYFGDHTATLLGFDSFNPARHIDLYTVVLMIGIVIPSVLLNLSVDSICMMILILQMTGQISVRQSIPLNFHNLHHREKDVAFLSILRVLSGFFVAWLVVFFIKIISILGIIQKPSLVMLIAPVGVYIATMLIFFQLFSLFPWPPYEMYYILQYFSPEVTDFIDEIPHPILMTIQLFIYLSMFQFQFFSRLASFLGLLLAKLAFLI